MANNIVTLDPNDLSLFPGLVPFVCGLQDEGKQDKKKPHVIKYGSLDRLARDIVDRLAKHEPPGMPANVTRRKHDVTKILVSMRKHVDKTSARLELVSIVNDPKNKITLVSEPEKMFVVTNDIANAGFNVAMTALLAAWSQRSVGTNLSRTPNDALRVASIMLDADIRGGIHGLLCSRRDRNKQDQPISTEQGLYEVCVEKFNDPSYIARVPNEVELLENYEFMDPNDTERISIQREWNWFKSTWEDYLRKKYRDALKRWNKDTGGGDGTNPSFQDYCGGEKWLAFVFLCDADTNFLLASNASGKVPRNLTNESGFSESGIDDGANAKRSTKKTLEAAIIDIQEKSATLYASLDKVVTSIGAKVGEKSDSLSGDSERNIDHKSIHGIMGEIEKLRGHERLLESEDSYTPMTKEAISDGIKKRKVELGNMAKTLFSSDAPKND
jgi:hypothetical protein